MRLIREKDRIVLDGEGDVIIKINKTPCLSINFGEKGVENINVEFRGMRFIGLRNFRDRLKLALLILTKGKVSMM